MRTEFIDTTSRDLAIESPHDRNVGHVLWIKADLPSGR